MPDSKELFGAEKMVPWYIQATLYSNLFFMFFLFRQPFDFYLGYAFVFAILPLFILKYGVPRHVGIVFSILLLSAFGEILLENNTFGSFFKVFIGASIFYTFFYYVVFKIGISIHSLFKIYLTGSLICGIIALVQLISYLVGFVPGYDLTWIHRTFSVVPGGFFGIRVSAFFGEPTYLAMFTSGAIFVAIHDLLYQSKAYYYSRWSAALLIIGIYASFSGTLVGTLVFSVVIIGVNYGLLRYILFGFPVAALILFFIVTSTEDFERRYTGTLGLFLDAPQEEFNVFDYHGSSVILYNNFFIAKENFKRNPLFGTGLGSHPIAAEKYSLTKNVTTKGFTLNTRDANSMFNRLMSETGLFGLGLFAFILIKFYIRRNDQSTDEFWLISSACLVLILVNMLRQGHYFLNGFPFYVWLYVRSFYERNWNDENDHSDLEEDIVQLNQGT